MRVWLTPDEQDTTVVVEQDLVRHVGPGARAGRVDTETVIALDCSNALIRPGRVNAHTHLYSGLVSLGMPKLKHKPKNFLEILQTLWWKLDRALDEDLIRASARYYIAEALLAGTTTLIDHHESPSRIERSLDILADACDELGMRALLCYGATERNEGRREAHRGLSENGRFIRENQRPLVRGLIGLHASFTVSDDTIKEAGEWSRDLETVVHVHLAEDKADVDDARQRGYPGPLERLLDLRALQPGSILAHGVHLSREQVRRASTLGLWFVQNPRSNKNNRVGYPSSLGSTHRVALGTDGFPSNMVDERETLRKLVIREMDDKGAAGARFDAGTVLVGERFDASFSPLAPGSKADIVVFDKNAVRHVLVDGRIVVWDGKLKTGNITEIRETAVREAARLWKRMGLL